MAISDNTNTPEVREGTSYVTPEMTVQSQLETILQDDNPLLKRAESFADARSQQSGLLSSSMATGAAAGALYDVAVPIATSDASTYAAFGGEEQRQEGMLRQTGYEGDIQGELDLQKGEIESRHIGERGDESVRLQNVADTGAMDRLNVSEAGTLERLGISEAGSMERLVVSETGLTDRLATTEAGAMERLTTQEAGQNARQIISEAGLDARLTEELISLENRTVADNINRLAVVDKQVAGDYAVTLATIDQKDRAAYADATSQMVTNWNRDYANIMQTPDDILDANAKSQVIANMNENFDNQLDLFTEAFTLPGLDWVGGNMSPSEQLGGPEDQEEGYNGNMKYLETEQGSNEWYLNPDFQTNEAVVVDPDTGEPTTPTPPPTTNPGGYINPADMGYYNYNSDYYLGGYYPGGDNYYDGYGP